MIQNKNTNSLLDRLERLDLTTEISTVAHVTVTLIQTQEKPDIELRRKVED